MTFIHRWFRFDASAERLASGAGLGCGLTAVDRRDAEAMLAASVFGGGPLPAVLEVVEDVDVRDLDEGHVLPNLGDPSARGVWFPRLWRTVDACSA